MLMLAVNTFVSTAGQSSGEATLTNPAALEAYRGKDRVLLVFVPSLHDVSYLEQKRIFDEADVGLADRDLLVCYLFADAPSGAATLHERFYNRVDAFTAIFIGKDGGEKERFLEPVNPETLFAIADQVPMRRHEVERRGQ